MPHKTFGGKGNVPSFVNTFRESQKKDALNEMLKKTDEIISKLEDRLHKPELDKINKSSNIVQQNIKQAKNMSPNEWKNTVQNKGLWDYKQQSGNLANFGNFNAGATGAAMLDSYGVPRAEAEQLLLRGGGWAQGKAGTSSSEWGNYKDNIPFVGNTNPNSSYGDDPTDQYFIQQGINYYYNHRE